MCAATQPVSFRSVAEYEVPGLGHVSVVLTERVRHDFDDVVGHIVIVDDQPIRVRGVEAFAVVRPYPMGWPIGLLSAYQTPDG